MARSTKIPEVIKAHPSRADTVMNLKENYFPNAHVCMDHGLGLFRNTLRQYEMAKTHSKKIGSEWVFLMEDDVVPVQNLSDCLTKLVRRLPENAAFGSLYSMNVPDEEKEAYESGEFGFIEQGYTSFVACLVRSEVLDLMIREMKDLISLLKSGEISERSHDGRISERVVINNENPWKSFVFVPSLVQHIGEDSIVGWPLIDSAGRTRNSPTFPGTDRDAEEYIL